MKIFLNLICVLACNFCFAQFEYLKAGEQMPDIVIKNIINAPVKDLYVNDVKNKKILILNFWGTWCSPCLPEMEALAKLQKANPDKIQVIAISNDSPERLGNYLKKKPSSLWLATDTSYFLYNSLGFAFVGQSVVIGADKRIIALVKSDSINQKMIDKLVKAEYVASSASIKEAAVNTAEDAFGVDSLTQESFTVRGYMKGKPGMSQKPNQGPYAFRRVSWYNTCVTRMLNDAYGIKSQAQVKYETDEKQICDYNDHEFLYCADILVKPDEKDSFYSIMQKKLSALLPVKFRIEYRDMPVYVLKRKEGAALSMPVSSETATSYSFNGNGYEGTAVLVSEFADNYLTNEIGLPVIDETGLTDRYDIKTVIELRTMDNVRAAIEKLGLTLEKAERRVKVIIYMGRKKIN